MRANEQAVKIEAERVLHFLASSPNGHTTAERPVVRHLLLATDGTLLASGYRYDIQTKNLGAGVYQLSLQARE